MSETRTIWKTAKAQADQSWTKIKAVLADGAKLGPLLDKFAAAETDYQKGMLATATKPDPKKELTLKKRALEATKAANLAAGIYSQKLESVKDKLNGAMVDELRAVLMRIQNELRLGLTRYKI